MSPGGQAARFLDEAGDTQLPQRHSETWERCCWSQEVRRQKVAIEMIDSCPGYESDEDPWGPVVAYSCWALAVHFPHVPYSSMSWPVRVNP